MSIQLRKSLSQDTNNDAESGYDSVGSNSVASLQTIYFTPPHLKYINAQLQELEPEGMCSHDTRSA
jgi:phosphoadenosine phosphosulfate reductase